ncbi:MAG: DUF2182 domain-containing protein [Mesorhizobium sp.]|nr:DUF2182 domain-containing protein [Mesorhizobium sp.]MBX9461400.1 DUF2182 domain-containing protein [Aquamicrobium sp.]
MSELRDDFSRLDAPGRMAAGLAGRAKVIVYASVGLAVVLSWLVLAAIAHRVSQGALPATQGPGADLLAVLPDLPLPAFLERFFALCLSPVPAGNPAAEFLALLAMWFLMALAMMLPTAAPMVRTYCEIADTAARKGEPVAHPLVLVAGYLGVWLLASAMFAALTVALRQAGAVAGALGPVEASVAALALLLAGLYQFSSLKAACLEKCRNPFTVLFSRWSARPAGILRLGAEQGLWCLGCCWALMLVMFAVGLMNIFWMALLAVFSLVEKETTGALPTRLAGAILLVWATALLVVSW